MAWMVCKPRNPGGWARRPGPLYPCPLRACPLPNPRRVANRFFWPLIELNVRWGDKREGCRVPRWRHFAKWYDLTFSSEGTFWPTFPVRRPVWRGNLYLSGCLCWVIMCLLDARSLLIYVFLSRRDNFTLRLRRHALWAVFSVLWIILDFASVPYLFHLIRFFFLIAQECYRSWRELPGWCLKYRNNNLFEMGKLRNIISYPKYFPWDWATLWLFRWNWIIFPFGL